MSTPQAFADNEVKKMHLEEVVLFAINHIPHSDPLTLKRFLELVNASGTFGRVTHEQILRKMDQILRYIPGAKASSLLIVLDLLDINAPNNLLLSATLPENGAQPAAQPARPAPATRSRWYQGLTNIFATN